ncbi:MAG: M20/M25/M40 family metallo-hydrolase [Chlorobia bacterium]|nr:M20/M25/M40 family metallo-hydrolase [Fimbriimonadaceae bacterium]
MLLMIAMTAIAQGTIVPEDLAKQVDQKRLRATVEKLATWNDRNTNNPTLTESANWVADQYRAIPGLEVELMKYKLPKMARVPEEKEVVQVVATLKGETDRRIIIGGHLDTINMADRDNGLNARAPGANDDASGVAMAMELARIMSQKKWKNTLVFVAFSGEEQGLYGSKALAERAVKEGWKIDAVLSNDMIGNVKNPVGQKNEKLVRVFSAEYQAVGESKAHQSRELARVIEFLTRESVDNFGVKLVFRNDRFGRGGDHTPFMQAGFSAVRFTEAVENYTHQHTIDDLPEHMDWRYLANSAKIDLIAMAHLGDAGEQPTNVRINRAQGYDTTVTWKGTPGTRYTVYWRETLSPVWQGSVRLGVVETYTAKKLSKDDYIFAVGAVGGIPVEAK